MRARESNDIRLVRADVKIDGSTIFVTFCPAEEGWPFTIENDSDYTLSVSQTVKAIFLSLKVIFHNNMHRTAVGLIPSLSNPALYIRSLLGRN